MLQDKKITIHPPGLSEDIAETLINHSHEIISGNYSWEDSPLEKYSIRYLSDKEGQL